MIMTNNTPVDVLSSSFDKDSSHASTTVSTDASNPDPQTVDSLLAREFFSLSFQDRNDINEEMHGVSCLTPEETTEMIDASLEKLEAEIALIPSEKKKMYELSQKRYGKKNSSQEGGSYVNDVDFRVRFLRVDLFDAAKAAERMTIFLDQVVEMFGEYALQRPIRLSDFTEDELQAIRMGNLQLLPFRDRSGRRIIAGVEGLATQFDILLRIKILYYLMWAAGDDIETQKKGAIVCIWPVTETLKKSYNSKDEMKFLAHKDRYKGSCVRIVAFHFCMDDNPVNHVLRMAFAMLLNKEKRSRLKFHVGQMTELQYILQGYGIPVDHIPLTGTGNVKTQNLRIWLKLRSSLEEPKEEDEDIIECPYSNDVLFRPSKLIKGHPGNVKFQSLIEYYHEMGTGITATSKKIVAEITEGGGRILVWDKKGWWTNLTDPAQMQFKISVSCRDYKKKNKGKPQSYDSSTFAFHDQEGKKRKRQEDPGSLTSSSVGKMKNVCNFLNTSASRIQ